ncbi:MAG: monophosphatase, partial [Solirubrobacteraceae bacterium]|nr:monophosphatase [Solirubrobacteraceae bacterium]
DRTLIIDAEAEAAVVTELERLHGEGARFTLVSEELGTRDFGSPDVLVVVDPIDGSTNAKRGLPHHSISIAVADGMTAADVAFGFVYDYGPEEEWTARRGEGAFLDGVRLDPSVPERRSADGRVELLGIESADPRRVRAVADGLAESAYRLRVIGSMAVTLCQVAAARLDAMVTLRRARAVDVAAGQLIVREAGGLVAFCACEEPLGAPLVVEARSPVVAARSAETLEALRRLVA